MFKTLRVRKIFIILIVIVSIFCHVNGDENFITDNFHVVVKNQCYRSAQLSSLKLTHYIKKFGIKTIINLRGKQDASWWYNENSVAQKHQVILVNIKMKASELPARDSIKNLLEIYPKSVRPVLLHCSHGINRAGLASALWILDQQNGTKEDALRQFDTTHGYNEKKHPFPKKFITLWQGRNWALNIYNPIKPLLDK